MLPGVGICLKNPTYLQRLRERQRVLFGVVLLLADPARLAEENDRVEHVSAIHAGRALCRFVGIESEETSLRVNRAPRALQAALVGEARQRVKLAKGCIS